MFGWFRNVCTVDPVTRAWIDRRWAWLEEQFGLDVVTSATVTPTGQWFPEPVSPDDDDSIERLTRRVCKRMHVARESIDLQLYTNDRKFEIVNEQGHSVGLAAGTYRKHEDRFLIRIERQRASRPMALIGTIAHELAHVRLMGEGRLSGDEFDNELCTDLTAVMHGFGIFRANCPAYWARDKSVWPGTDVPMPRYMTTPMYGYALALRHLRQGLDDSRDWRKHLIPGVRAEFDQSIRCFATEQKQQSKARKPR